MQSHEIRERFLQFFESKGCARLPSASLLPENDPSVLFNTAGMQPLVPYLLGQSHPLGTRLVNSQKCVRTNDIEEVGDKSHLTFFEMLGHWSLGDYFKREAIEWIYEFLTSKEKGLGLDPNRVYATVFEGNDDAPADTVAADIWAELIPAERIYFLDADENWWSAGDNGPCGPDSEIFYDLTEEGLGELSKEDFLLNCDKLNIIEIANSVFMEYLKTEGEVTGKLESQNVDFGAGLERWAILMQQKESIYETDIFSGLIELIESNSQVPYAQAKSDYRIIADHLRSAVFMISDGARPSNKDQGYILRRLLRRSIVHMDSVGFNIENISDLVKWIVEKYRDVYVNLGEQSTEIIEEVIVEQSKFAKTLQQGMREFEKIVDRNNSRDNVSVQEFGLHNATSHVNEVSADEAFHMFATYGFPLELIREQAEKSDLRIDEEGFTKLLEEHQEKSRTASAGKFKGGLGGDTPLVRALHTATHLMLQGLRNVLGDHVHQAGSNTTEERIRFDFTHGEKVTREQLNQVEEYVRNAIVQAAVVTTEEMSKIAAREANVEGSFWEKYPDTVTVYTMTGPDGTVYSRELCGGPHVENTSQLSTFGEFKILKEESSSAGVRRVKATLQ